MAGSEASTLRSLPDSGKLGWRPAADVFPERIGPGRLRRQFLHKHVNHAVAAEAHTPHEVVFSGGVVSHLHGPTGGKNLAGVGDDVVLQAAAAD